MHFPAAVDYISSSSYLYFLSTYLQKLVWRMHDLLLVESCVSRTQRTVSVSNASGVNVADGK